MNSLPQGDTVEKYVDEKTSDYLQKAKQETLELFVNILELRKVSHSYSALTLATSS